MFETSVIAIHSQRPQRKAGLFSVSVALHTLVVVAAVTAGIQSISFPTNAPNQSATFNPTIPVVMPPGGGGGAVQRPQPAAVKPPAAQQQQITAPAEPATPQTIPDAIPNVAAMSTADVGNPGLGTPGIVGPGTGGPGGPGGPGPVGPGIGDAPVTTPVPNVIFTAGGDVKPATVISRVAPSYPALPLKMHMGGTVTVHCVIDRNGRIREPQVVSTTSTLFNQAAIDAVQQWTFAPGSMHGQSVDTYFELKVTFSVR